MGASIFSWNGKEEGKWKYFYRAVDSNGGTIDFVLSAKRNRKAAKRSLRKFWVLIIIKFQE